jgi:hypothetical protein
MGSREGSLPLPPHRQTTHPLGREKFSVSAFHAKEGYVPSLVQLSFLLLTLYIFLTVGVYQSTLFCCSLRFDLFKEG